MKSLAKGIYSNYIQPIAKKGTELGKKLSKKIETSKISQVRYAKCKFFLIQNWLHVQEKLFSMSAKELLKAQKKLEGKLAGKQKT